MTEYLPSANCAVTPQPVLPFSASVVEEMLLAVLLALLLEALPALLEDAAEEVLLLLLEALREVFVLLLDDELEILSADVVPLSPDPPPPPHAAAMSITRQLLIHILDLYEYCTPYSIVLFDEIDRGGIGCRSQGF